MYVYVNDRQTCMYVLAVERKRFIHSASFVFPADRQTNREERRCSATTKKTGSWSRDPVGNSKTMRFFCASSLLPFRGKRRCLSVSFSHLKSHLWMWFFRALSFKFLLFSALILRLNAQQENGNKFREREATDDQLPYPILWVLPTLVNIYFFVDLIIRACRLCRRFIHSFHVLPCYFILWCISTFITYLCFMTLVVLIVDNEDELNDLNVQWRPLW